MRPLFIPLTAISVLAGALLAPSSCVAADWLGPLRKVFRNDDQSFYQAPEYGAPVGIPVAPCVRHGINYRWGVPSLDVSCVHGRYRANEDDLVPFGGPYPVAPYWPTSTHQLGYYYLAAPH